MKKDEVKDKTKKQNDKKSKKVSHKIDSSSQIDKKQSRMLSEILAPLFGCHQKFLLDDLRGRWSFGMKSEFEVSDDLINDFMILDKRDNPHPTPTLRTDKRAYLINFSDHLSPASGRHKRSLIFNDWRVGRI